MIYPNCAETCSFVYTRNQLTVIYTSNTLTFRIINDLMLLLWEKNYFLFSVISFSGVYNYFHILVMGALTAGAIFLAVCSVFLLFSRLLLSFAFLN